MPISPLAPVIVMRMILVRRSGPDGFELLGLAARVADLASRATSAVPWALAWSATAAATASHTSRLKTLGIT